MSAIAGIPYYEIGRIDELYCVYYLKDDGTVSEPGRDVANCLNLPKKFLLPNMSRGCISIGGGDGEKPAIAFHSPLQAVSYYLVELLNIQKNEASSALHACGAFYDPVSIEYCFWSNQMHREFYDDFKERIADCWDAFNLDSWYEGDIVEMYLLVIVGSFLFHYPWYTDPQVVEFRAEYGDLVEKQSERAQLVSVIKPFSTPQPGPMEHKKLIRELAESGSIC